MIEHSFVKLACSNIDLRTRFRAQISVPFSLSLSQFTDLFSHSRPRLLPLQFTELFLSLCNAFIFSLPISFLFTFTGSLLSSSTNRDGDELEETQKGGEKFSSHFPTSQTHICIFSLTESGGGLASEDKKLLLERYGFDPNEFLSEPKTRRRKEEQVSEKEAKRPRTTHKLLQVLGRKAKRKKLLSAKGMDVRPMMKVVKGAAFDILQVAGGCPASLQPGPWLDLYSGTGSVGTEAISRGCSEEFARDRLLVELAQERATTIHANQDSQAKASSSAAAVGASLGAGLGIVLAVVMGAASALRKP